LQRLWLEFREKEEKWKARKGRRRRMVFAGSDLYGMSNEASEPFTTSGMDANK